MLIAFNKPYGVVSQFLPKGEWRTLAEFEWRHVALAALGYGVLLAPGQDVWFPLGVVATHVVAFAMSARVAWRRDALILPAA